MNDSKQTLGRSIKLILSALGIFVAFGFLALLFSGFAGNESPEDRAYKGEFSEEVTATRWANLKEIEKAQSEAFDQTKVDEALKKIGSAAAKPVKTEIVIPGSPTFLKQSQQPPAAADTPAAADDTEKEGSESNPPVIEPKKPDPAAPEETEKPKAEVKAKEAAKPKAEGEAKPKSEAKPKGDVKAKADAKTKTPAKSAPAE